MYSQHKPGMDATKVAPQTDQILHKNFILLIIPDMVSMLWCNDKASNDNFMGSQIACSTISSCHLWISPWFWMKFSFDAAICWYSILCSWQLEVRCQAFLSWVYCLSCVDLTLICHIYHSIEYLQLVMTNICHFFKHEHFLNAIV